MRKITDQTTLVEDDAYDLDAEARRYIETGWQPLGHPIVVTCGAANSFVQTFVQYGEAE